MQSVVLFFEIHIMLIDLTEAAKWCTHITLYAEPECLQNYKFYAIQFFTIIFNLISQDLHCVACRLSNDYYPRYWFGGPTDRR